MSPCVCALLMRLQATGNTSVFIGSTSLTCAHPQWQQLYINSDCVSLCRFKASSVLKRSCSWHTRTHTHWETRRQDGDSSLSVTRIHPVEKLQTNRKSLLLWVTVINTQANTAITLTSVMFCEVMFRKCYCI